MIYRYPLPSEKKRVKAEQLVDAVYYLSEYITDVRLHEECVEVAYTGDEEPAQFQARLDRYMRVGLLARIAPKQILHDNRMERQPVHAGTEARLSPGGGLHLAGEEVLLAQALDRIFQELAEQAGAVWRNYPTLMTAQQMKQGGYLTHFPQHMYGICEIAHEESRLREYREQTEEEKQSGQLLQPNGLFLQPCLCFHVYDELAKRGTEHIDGLAVYSAVGKCYRHEHRSRLSPTRFREFMMREIVYVGEAGRVVETREHLVAETWSLFEELGLRGYVESATDSFFYEDDSVLMYQQSAHALKFELRSAFMEEKDFSLASFNLCGPVLCEAFGVMGDQEALHSGCTGFGIDRWVQALLAVHGRDTGCWPDKLQASMQA